MTTTTWRADPLNGGRGPRAFEMFVRPTCDKGSGDAVSSWVAKLPPG
jgi:hypothetical protein